MGQGYIPIVDRLLQAMFRISSSAYSCLVGDALQWIWTISSLFYWLSQVFWYVLKRVSTHCSLSVSKDPSISEFPNVKTSVAIYEYIYIFLCAGVSGYKAGRSLSRMGRMKNCMRSCLSDKKLSNICILSTEFYLTRSLWGTLLLKKSRQNIV